MARDRLRLQRARTDRSGSEEGHKANRQRGLASGEGLQVKQGVSLAVWSVPIRPLLDKPTLKQRKQVVVPSEEFDGDERGHVPCAA